MVSDFSVKEMGVGVGVGAGVLRMGRGGLKLLLYRMGRLTRETQKTTQH